MNDKEDSFHAPKIWYKHFILLFL